MSADSTNNGKPTRPKKSSDTQNNSLVASSSIVTPPMTSSTEQPDQSLSLTSFSNSSSSSSSPATRAPSKYAVASHSVRVTKHGYAIDPIELKYPEIASNLSVASRRLSEVAFDPTQIGYRMLNLIRGFWSQPAFPRGKQVKQSSSATIGTILYDYSKNPVYPHSATYVDMAGSAPESNSSRSESRRRRRRNIARMNSAALQERLRASPFSSTNYLGSAASTNAVTGSQPSSSPKTTSSDEIIDDQVLNKDIRNKFKTLVSSPNDNFSRSLPNTKKSSIFSFLSSHDRKSTQVTSQSVPTTYQLPFSPPSSPPMSTPEPKQKDSKIQRSNSLSTSFTSWIPQNKEHIFEQISLLCHKMERVFAAESRIINVESPCTVLGDIHGNLQDLRTYERSLWPKAPVCVSGSYLFLGDYVDRGDYSVECVLYLFSMKLISPNRFFMLRGNHEVSAIQKQYTFSRECDIKFGAFGRQIWKLFNKVFDLMPIAAIIDHQIFCAHGGIPKSISNVKTLSKEIPSPLPNPEVQCSSAWEILWNDPITDSELIGMVEMDSAVLRQSDVAGPTSPSDQTTTTAEPNSSSSSTTTTVDIPNSSTHPQSVPSELTSTVLQAAQKNQEQQQQDDQADPPPLSTYIRQTEPSELQQNSMRATNANDISDNQESDRLTLMPSDTSSIASTRPQDIINDGFVANIKRGTAYLFSDKAVQNFLNLNNLSHVIRAHEVIPTGFAFHGDGRVITIFSSSRYCGLNNQAACALVYGDRIRILRLDTGDNGD